MDDIEKLRILLPHWMEHNEEHAAEFEAWAQKVAQTGQGEAADKIRQAAGFVREANESLGVALENVGGAAPDEGHFHSHSHSHTHPHSH